MPAPLHIVFLCSGNLCRSPLAEAICREALRSAGADVRISSAGTLGIEDQPPAGHAVQAAFQLGIDMSAHRSRGVSRDDLLAADHVLCMAEEHVRAARLMAPEAESRLDRLWEYTDEPGRLGEIADPIGGDLEQFLDCRDDIIECLRNWLAARVPETGGVPPAS